jgi:(1->4)-alpha-D-glucan 1-alpha-D-glucosylmutase
LGDKLRFEDARALVPYLSNLGIGAVYLSPFFRARQGSTHRYDVVDHRQLDPRLGDEGDFQRLAETLRDHEMGLMIDIVPNHMGIDDPHNVWWQDVLENGPGSTYAKYFDIDWYPPKEGLQGKVLLPVLGDQFGKILEDQELHLGYEDQRFVIGYHERRLPTDPRTWVVLLKQALESVADRLTSDAPERMELESIVTALEHLPPRTELGAEAVQQRYREQEVARRRLSTLHESSAEIRQGIERAIEDYNGRRGDRASFDKLESLLAEQAYRLCHWRVATDEINYRRFFDVDSLAAIRVEEPEVFDAVHQMVLRFIEHGWVTGLRIDHADGLLDPEQYLTTLIDAVGRARAHGQAAPAIADQSPLYVIVEKILARDETLPTSWPIDGTTGYEFLNLLNGLFVDRRGAYALYTAYSRFTGQPHSFIQVLYESKRTILATSLSSELYMLSQRLDRLSEQDRWSRDFTRLSLYRALREVVACFPVYRTYIRPDSDEVRQEDRQRIGAAVRTAKRRNPVMSPSFFDFIGSVLLLEDPPGLSEEARHERRQFALKFQQVTGPVTAKGLEDTAFYRIYPLASLNEVGGDPTIPGTTVEQFHRRVRETMTRWPRDLLTTGTHDTKRGEDLRARLNVLAEIPEQWEAAVQRWRGMNAPAQIELEGAAVPDANEEYLIYQTLVGTWPTSKLDDEAARAYVERIVAYMDKALREAKLHTSWLNPYHEYDQAVASFIRTILDRGKSPFVDDLDAFVRSIADVGFVNSLAQTLIKICAPGIADIWQGAEFWDFNLVDPDNRRLVDFAAREQALDGLVSRAQEDLPRLADELVAAWPDKRIKLFVIWRALQFRREQAEVFDGDYQPFEAEGPRQAHLFAFARTAGSRWALCIVPRLARQAWQDCVPEGVRRNSTGEAWPIATWWPETVVQLPPEAPERWRHVFTGRSVNVTHSGDRRLLDMGEVLGQFPVALLWGETQ